MATIIRQFESKHIVTTITIQSTSVEGHSLLSQERAAFEKVAESQVLPNVSLVEATNGRDTLHNMDHLVDEHCRTKG